MAGKGSTTRPTDHEKYARAYKRIFGTEAARIRRNRRRSTRRQRAKNRGRKHDSRNFRSFCSGVAPAQAAEMTKEFGHLGVKYDPVSGDAIYKDRNAKIRVLNARGYHDMQEVRG